MVVPSFDTQFYNNLPSISDADSAFVDREAHFSKLAPILSKEEYRGVYEVCLFHHHFDLEQGEKMVSYGSISLSVPYSTTSSYQSVGQPMDSRSNFAK
jgi:hypothetical protein